MMTTDSLVIEAVGLVKDYDGVQAVRGLDLRVPRGSIYGFLGRNGAGKTTTLKMLLGMVRPSAGEGRILGHRIDDRAESVEIRRRTGFVSEDKGLYDYMTVEQMLRFMRPFYPTWNTENEKRYLSVFELPLKRKVRELSKGMRTKLALMLALARGAELLILDEPTEGLDPAVTEEVLQALVGVVASGEATIFFSSHQIAEVEQIAERVLIIDKGRAVVEGQLDELKQEYRRVNLSFKREAPAETLFAGAAHIVEAKRTGRWLSLLVSSGADGVVARAHALDAVSVDVVPVGLKEIFLKTVSGEPVDAQPAERPVETAASL